MVERLLIALPSQLQLIDRLQHLIYLSSSLIFIAGRKGAGKTVLMEQLSNHLPHATQEAFIHLNEPLPDAHIRQQIITQLFEHPLFDANDSLFSSFVQLQEKFKFDPDGMKNAVDSYSKNLIESTPTVYKNYVSNILAQKNLANLQEAIGISHLNVTPSGVISFSYLGPLIFIVLGSIIGFMLPFLLAGESSLFFVLLAFLFLFASN